MTSSKKIIIGVLTAIPAIFVLLYFIFIFSFVFNIDDPGFNPESVFDNFSTIFAFGIVFMLLSFGLTIYYLVDILKYNKRFQEDSNKKIVWLLIILIANIIGMTIYYFMEILPRQQEEVLPAYPLDNEMMNED